MVTPAISIPDLSTAPHRTAPHSFTAAILERLLCHALKRRGCVSPVIESSLCCAVHASGCIASPEPLQAEINKNPTFNTWLPCRSVLIHSVLPRPYVGYCLNRGGRGAVGRAGKALSSRRSFSDKMSLDLLPCPERNFCLTPHGHQHEKLPH